MTVTGVLAGYAAVVASLALAISLLVVRALPPGTARGGLPSGGALPPSGPEVGSPAPPILGRTKTGATFDSVELAGRPHLIAFLSSSCPGCRTTLPSLAGYLGASGSLPLVVVITGDPQRGAELEQLLAPTATAVFEPAGGPIAAAYRITVFPSFVLVSADATVLATGRSVRDLPQPQTQPQL